ncbi:MAG: ABC transporter permease subunit, partial [Acidimicrobiia bacterium]|nr:ABC transporter permease subunit [Acidimicrobiia bacterium]
MPKRVVAPRRRALALILLGFGCSVALARSPGGVVNTRGWPAFRRFWEAAIDPDLSSAFVRITVEAAQVTLGFAMLGTLLSLVLGAVGALVLSELTVERAGARRLFAAALVVPRAVHEIVWALLLIQVLGFDPMVAVLAIGIPFGAITAKVFAETLDEAPRAPYLRLRAIGAGRLQALTYGTLPVVRSELVSYAFYRLECAIRSAAVLGVIGAGGLGFQLDLSFESLRYREIWTLIFALMVLSGLADSWSSRVRRSTESTVRNRSLVAIAVLVPLSWWWADMGSSQLLSTRTVRRSVELVGDLIPPRLGPGGWGELLESTADTVAMSIIAILIAVVVGLLLGLVAARPRALRPDPLGVLFRIVLLLFRSVPPVVWAFLVVLVVRPGIWPGAIALAVYNVGVLGRLFAEVFEDRDDTSARRLRSIGATRLQAAMHASVPETAPRIVSLGLYRWEVVVRESVMVGVVGAGALGQLLN